MPIFKRVSCREFTEEKVSKADILEILRAGMQAPSARNQQPWEFLIVDDKEKIKALAERGHYLRSLNTAPLLIIPFYRTELVSPNYVLQDMSACVQNMLLQISALSLGGVWMGGAPNEERMQFIVDNFGGVEGCKPFCMIAVGHPVEDKPQTSRFDESRIHYTK